MWFFKSMPARSKGRGTLDQVRADRNRPATIPSRVPVAAVLGCFGLIAYIGLAVTLADRVTHTHWLAQALYFVIAGSVWVLPMRWLMLWAARLR